MSHVRTSLGFGEPDLKHWQCQKDNRYPIWNPLMGIDWNTLDKAPGLNILERAILSYVKAPFIAAHILGCALLAHWRQRHELSILKGALLVAPADIDVPHRVPAESAIFAPITLPTLSLPTLPFPSIVITSRNDRYVDISHAQIFTLVWGFEFINLGQGREQLQNLANTNKFHSS